MKKVEKHDGGFTLIEILLALAILGMVIVPVTGLFLSSVENNYKTGRDIIALMVARDIMDRIKAGDANIGEEIHDYKEKYGVEIAVTAHETAKNHRLSIIKVYVTPRKGMSAINQGLMLASYSTNVFIAPVDTSLPGNVNANGGNDDSIGARSGVNDGGDTASQSSERN